MSQIQDDKGYVFWPEKKQEYFILSLVNSNGANLSWWRPNSSGYCWSLDHAGRYSEEEIKTFTHPERDRPIPVEKVLEVAVRHVEFEQAEKLGVSVREIFTARNS